jgi:DNA polymerase-3 subunit gamma/tau
LKVAPSAQGFFDGASGEAKRAAALAAKMSVPSLTRAWQILLKGLFEVRDATRPISACEMALIRLAYAAELPPADKLVKDILDGNAPASRGASPSGGAPTGGGRGPAASAVARTAPQAQAVPDGAPVLHGLGDIALMAQKNGAPVLKVHIENDMHLVKLEAGRLEFRPSARAPRSLAGDLQQRLRDWTGVRWTVSISNEPGQPTLAEQKKSAKAARIESVMQAPLVRAVLDRFPGAEIVAVRDVETPEVAPEAPDSADS